MGFVGSEDDLKAFNDYINGTYPNLKFTMGYSRKKMHFLDLQIAVNKNRRLETSANRKNTDRNTDLHATSFHPNRLINNFPHGQFIRLRRIRSNEEDHHIKAKEMAERFKQRGYSKSLIDRAIEKANKKEREELLNPPPTQHENENRVTFVSEYSQLLGKSNGLSTDTGKY